MAKKSEVTLLRDITIYNSVGQSKRTIKSAALTLGQLKPELEAAGISYNGMQLVIGETQGHLELEDASLMAGNFTLFMMPRKVKSGLSLSKAA